MTARSSAPVIGVNGRFVTQPLTGVQRYAHEVVSRLAATSGWRIRLHLPPDRTIDLEPGQRSDAACFAGLDERWWGGRGHLWEQTQLLRLQRRAKADLLLSPAGWGPLTLRRQLAVIFDLHAVMHPEHFVTGYVWWTRLATPFLTHVPPRVAVISDHVAGQVTSRLHVDAARIDVVPPAVGPPFLDRPLSVEPRRRTHCLFVGGDKAQKNLAFVLDLWPEVHRATGLELVVTERSVGSRIRWRGSSDPAGVRRVQDPDDEALAELYESALCLLWPSLAEGYGIPLLESMAVGTPFLSTDVGASRELAIDPGQVLPAEPRRWVDQLLRWARASGEGDGELARIRRIGVERARAATWDHSAELMVESLERTLARLDR